MNEQTVEILKLVAAFLTPLIILIVGLAINRNLEKSKAALSKEKDWQNWWAGKLLSVAHEYNSTVSECVTCLFQLKQIEDEKLSGWETELKAKADCIRNIIRRLQYLDWEIQNYAQFAQAQGHTVLKTEKELYNLLGSLINTKQGNLEEIRKTQFEFNDAVRRAHAEILELTPNKLLQATRD